MRKYGYIKKRKVSIPLCTYPHLSDCLYYSSEYTLQRQLTQLKDQMTSLQTTHEVTQARLVDHTQKYDDEVAAKLGELEILEVDLERANGRIAVLERDNEILKRELEKFRGEGEWVEYVSSLPLRVSNV